MKIRKYLCAFILLFINFSFIPFGYCYWTNVHVKVTYNAIRRSSINDSLIKFGFINGIAEKIRNKDGVEKDISKWIEDGSVAEDDFWSPLVSARYLNHFYNPLTGKGLIDPPFLGTSSHKWASDDGHNEWTWKWARSYFYDGLSKTTKAQRNESLTKAFRALGQVTHLVQDLAVPAHVRNDAHSTGDPYEIYTSSKVNNLNYSLTAFPYWNLSISPYAPKQFWDLESYNGSVPYGSGYVGLSEYTNANFASLDTIFSEALFSVDPHYFPFPKKSSAVLYEESDSQSAKKTKYFKIDRDSEPIKYFAVAGRFYDLYSALPHWQRLFISFDDKCHNIYADLLIPRAVGYSAGLLNYFFRGGIDMVRDTENDACNYVVYNFSNEYMEGTFGLYYDDASGNRNSIPIGELTANANDKSEPVTLDITDEEKKKTQYILVFQGKMGNETNAVVADAKVTPFTSSCGTELTITGPDTVSQDSSEQFEVTGCTGCEDDVQWEITGEGANIDKDGLLTVDKTACGGTLILTAKCPICETEITKTITIPDSITISDPDSSNCYTASGGAGSYTWDISKGSIDSNGCVTTTTGQCGITTVTITDANGCKTTTTVTLPDTLTITGPEAPVDGSCYITTGGTEPYTWDITKGTIDENGCVDLKGQCGTATVKAKDVNECTGKKEVNIPAVPLDISGADMIAKNSSETYSASGCSKAVSWSVTGKGATIELLEKAGALLKTDETACREITITAKCPDCNTEASKNVSVSDTCGTLTISGSDTTVKSSARQYTMNGCCGEQKWSVSGAGVSISSAGLLTTTSSACGSLLVTATCAGCGTSATQEVRVTDAGHWEVVTNCVDQGCDTPQCYEIFEVDPILISGGTWYSESWLAHCRPVAKSACTKTTNDCVMLSPQPSPPDCSSIMPGTIFSGWCGYGSMVKKWQCL